MESFNSMLISVTGALDDFMYTYILVILLVFAGIYFTIRTKFVQIRYIKDMFTALAGKSAAADKEFGDFDKDVATLSATLEPFNTAKPSEIGLPLALIPERSCKM